MRKRIIFFIAAVIVGLGLFQTGRMVEAASSQPGTQSDPLITKSYLEQQLASVGGYSQILLERGDKLTFEAGAELIVCKGSGQISNGSMICVSSSELFRAGNSVVLYSLFVAAEDSTALTAQGSMTVLVRGSYR